MMVGSRLYTLPVLLLTLWVTIPCWANLSGSMVEANCTDCYTEWSTQTLCFEAHTYTDDGEAVHHLWLNFPADWEVTNVWDDGPTACDDPTATWGVFFWNYHTADLNEVRIDHARNHGTSDHCQTVYCVSVDTDGPVGHAHTSWYYSDDYGTGAAPHTPASSDGYTPVSLSAPDEQIYPPAPVAHCVPQVLLIQDAPPYGYTAWQTVLSAAGYYYDEIYSNEIVYIDLEEYDTIIVSGDQDGTFHTNVATYMTLFEDYVDNGGRLFFSSASASGAVPYADPPYGGTFTSGTESQDDIIAVQHPSVVGVPDPCGPNTWTSYGGISSPPYGIHPVASQQTSGLTSLYEYEMGLGLMMVTTQAVEQASAEAWDLAPVLENSLDYLMSYSLADGDLDGFGDCVDNCIDTYNPSQDDGDNDGLGDECDDCTDGDGDGYGDADVDTSGCPAGTDGDCDDTNAAVYPGATEVFDGADNDCDGLYDNGVMPANAVFITEVMKDPLTVGDTLGEWFEVYNNSAYDLNLIGMDVTDLATNAFTVDTDLWVPVGGQVVLGRNGDSGINGGVTLDFEYSNFQLSNTDDEIILSHYGVELDRIEYDDGVTWPDSEGIALSLDIVSYDGTLNDDGSAWCDAIDMYGVGDLGTPGIINPQCCFDADGDGFQDISCGGADCDDTNPDINPGIVELCDGIDDDCDGVVDNGHDLDGDLVTTCDGDCDDNDPAVNPAALEMCDGVDNDCDGDTDEADAVDAQSWYPDGDGDGYGTNVGGVTACAGPSGTVADNTDCDDADPWIHPGAVEMCNGLDDDCDPGTDENADVDGDGDIMCNDCDDNDGALNNIDADGDGQTSCDGDCDDYDPGVDSLDLDGDGYSSCDGDCDDTDALVQPVDLDGDGFTGCNGDCDDTNTAVYPSAVEVCDGVDNDCDPFTDELADNDLDGYTLCDGDCDDGHAAIYPGAPELCDGLDNDCNGTADDDLGQDDDGDGWTTCDGDCDDNSADTYPGAVEICDGLDNDCDGYPGTDELDNDGDGYTSCEGDCHDSHASLNLDDADGDGSTTCDGDCDDNDPAVYAGAEEICDGLDNDCNMYLGDGETDGDGDGWLICAGDCADTNPEINPGVEEICDGEDNNCDNVIDEGDVCGGGDDDDTAGPGACSCDSTGARNGLPASLMWIVLAGLLVRRRFF